MKTGLGLTAAVVAFALLIFAAAAGADGRYADASGDGNGAPDIQNVQITNDGNGLVTFRITMDALPQATDVVSDVGIDTDLNEWTGAPDWLGADYAFQVDQATGTYGFAHWNGSTWDASTPSSTVSISESTTTLTISVNQSELGSTNEFNYWVQTTKGDPSLNQYDQAPDNGNWNYSIAANGPTHQGPRLHAQAESPQTRQAVLVPADRRPRPQRPARDRDPARNPRHRNPRQL